MHRGEFIALESVVDPAGPSTAWDLENLLDIA